MTQILILFSSLNFFCFVHGTDFSFLYLWSLFELYQHFLLKQREWGEWESGGSEKNHLSTPLVYTHANTTQLLKIKF